MMSFGYIPDFKGKSFVKDFALKLLGYPYAPRRRQAEISIEDIGGAKGVILDVGCGDGVFDCELAKTAIPVGVDPNLRLLKKAKWRCETLNRTAHFVRADATRLPFKESVFDNAISLCVIEHIKDDFGVFCEIERCLKIDGRFAGSCATQKLPWVIPLFLKMPPWLKKRLLRDEISDYTTLEEFNGYLRKKYHEFHVYTEKSMNKLLERTGFENVYSKPNGGVLGGVLHGVMLCFSVFDWGSYTDGYGIKNAALFGLIFPFNYLGFLLDKLLGLNNYGINFVGVTSKSLLKQKERENL